MVEMIELACGVCARKFTRRATEHRRNQAKGRSVFCSVSCAAVISKNAKRCLEVVKECPFCKERFKSSTHSKAATFCSRSCASSGSVTEKGRKAYRAGRVENLLSTEEVLKRREAWKYVLLKNTLKKRKHEFEYRLGKYIYDLALLDTKTLVEFDGIEHAGKQQKKIDVKKDAAAKKAGFVIVRRTVVACRVIDPISVKGL